MKFKKLSLFLGLATSLALFVPCVAIPVNAEEEPIFTGDFEEEPIMGWCMLGGTGTMEIDTALKQVGNSSLHVSGRQLTWNGPSISLDKIIEPLETYRVSGWIYQDDAPSATVNCTFKFSDSVNVDSYIGVASPSIESGVWTHFEGTIESPEDLASATLYFESPDATLEFNIDGIEIFGKTPEAQPESEETESVDKYTFDFEAGFDEWISRGETRLIRTDEQHLSGNYSMLSTNREKTWNGPTVPIDGIERETEYTYEASVLYTDKKVADSIEFLIEVQYSYNGNETYDIIGSAVANRNEWTKITGTHVIPYGATKVMFYIQTPNPAEGLSEEDSTPTDLVSFYVDDISIMKSSLAGKSGFDFSKITENPTVPLIVIAGVVILLVLIVVIVRMSSHSSDDETESEEKSNEKEKVNDVLDVLDNTSDNKAPESKTEKSEPKAEETEKSDSAEKAEDKKENSDNSSNKNNSKKKKNKKKNSEDARSKEVFGIETFSYDDPDAATASDSEDGSDSPDSPFDGF